MAPMHPDQPTDDGPTPIVDADVVEDLSAPAGEEALEGVPVLAEVRGVVTPAPVMLPAVQAAAVAATGFVAGAATFALVRRRSARRLARARPPRRAVDALPIVGSRSFLVDIHLIARTRRK